MNLDPSTLVGNLATEHPLATRVFARHGIDYCCGGGLPLADVCERKGLDADQVLAEILAELERRDEPVKRWDQAPLSELVAHILETHHRPLDAELPRLAMMARKVYGVHGEKAPELLSEVLATVLELVAELPPHMMKEEQMLFPMILAGHGAKMDGAVSVMEHEHIRAGDLLRSLREITHDYEVPREACNTWRALWHGLEALEEDLHRHIHLENNVLFPRALREG